ncbi:tyrosine-type recombinase/integrase [Polynucleobacter hallstattensis]|uniref:tyrosine-type recombinase/integrase n=1 Tax=Polynucleobacter hallstattensis TaxID=1855586 RepID=UPI001C0E65D3|nr:integrase arm-type DNA-binding domain-containing protein [Polynucleobacter hallstattensis]MBU3562013.1 integrase arm-type DNA-binding domain-containing protein [Polynucleobacter hallstattensis]
MVFLNPALAKTSGGIIGGIQAKSNWIKNMVGGTSGKLTDKGIKSFIARKVIGSKLADGQGLYLLITRAKTASWRIKYRIEGKEKSYTIGTYPQSSLAQARLELKEVKASLNKGRDPVVARRITMAQAAAHSESTFRAVAEEWFAMKEKEWSLTHHTKSKRAFERDIYKALGELPIESITPSVIAKAIETINKRDVLETATRILQHLNGVFRYAQAKGLCEINSAAPVKEILPRKKINGRMPALLDWNSLGALLRAAEAARLSPSVRAAHRLLAFSATRISNVVQAEWKEFDLDADIPIWVIPRAKMKDHTRVGDHRIPLGPQITAELKQWGKLFGRKGYVFPSPTGNQFISRESLEKAYRVTLNMSGKHAPHGWRSAFSTLARDNGFEQDVVELALDHAHGNEVMRAYDRGERFTQRVGLYKWWGEKLTQAQNGAEVIELTKKVA